MTWRDHWAKSLRRAQVNQATCHESPLFCYGCLYLSLLWGKGYERNVIIVKTYFGVSTVRLPSPERVPQ